MNLLTVIALLQAAISLLTNPAIQADPNMMSVALSVSNQAMVLASQALQNTTTTVSNPVVTIDSSSTHVVVNIQQPSQVVPTPIVAPIGIGAPAEPSPTPAPSCTLTGTIIKYNGDNNIAFNWTGDGQGVLYGLSGINQAGAFYYHQILPLSEGVRNRPIFTNNELFYKASFQNTNCWAFFVNTSDAQEGDTSTTTIPSKYNQYTL